MTHAPFVLIVDPDRTLTRAVQAILSAEKYETTVMHDGEEAFQFCANRMPDIVLVEGLVPKIDGLELAKKIRAMPNGGLVSILLMSAVFAGKKFKSQIEEAGIDEVLAKPFTPEALLEKVHSFDKKLKTKSTPMVPEVEEEQFNPKGTISDVPFIRLVYLINKRKETGTLRLQRNDAKKLVTFENGEPKFVVSNLEQECLGQLLVRKGRLTPEECKQSLEVMSQMKQRQGETLIKLGLLEPYELDEALKQQAREKFCEIFAWQEGQFLFVPGKVFKKDLTAVDISIPQLCLRAIKEHYSLAMLQEEMAPYQTSVPQMKKDPTFSIEEFKLAAWDLKILRQVRDRKTLSQILEMKLARDVDVYHLFYCFFMLGIVQLVEATAPKEKAPKVQVDPDKNKTPFEILGVAEDADDERIRRAFDEKTAEARALSDGVARLKNLRNAYDTISSLQGRREYLVRLYEDAGKLPSNAREIFNPTELIVIGKKFLDKKNTERAKRVFEDGVRLFPEDGVLSAYLGFTMVQICVLRGEMDPEKIEKGRLLTIRGTKLSALSADVHYLMGRVFKMDNDESMAEKAFRRALSLDPNHREASAELRLIQMRQEKKKTTSFIKWKG